MRSPAQSSTQLPTSTPIFACRASSPGRRWAFLTSPSPGTAARSRPKGRRPSCDRPMTTRRVLLFATTTGYQIRMFDEAARRLGIDLRLVSDRCQVLDDPWRDHAIPVQYHDLDASMQAID